MTIESYKSLHKLGDLSAYDSIVCDEAQALRNTTTDTSKDVLKIIQVVKPKFLWFLSATPILRSASDLYPILKMLRGKAIPKKSEYEEMFCYMKPNRFKWNKLEAYGVRDVFWPWVQKDLGVEVICQRKDRVLMLPKKHEETIYIDVPPQHHLMTHGLTAEKVLKILEAGGGNEHYSVMRRELGIAKWEAIKEKFNPLIPYLIFAHHTELIERVAKDLRIPCITGSTSLAQRHKIVTEFQEGKYQGLVCSTGACGVGLTLTKANRFFWLEKPYLYAEQKQAEDRIHRIGQTNEVTIISYSASNTLDEPLEKNLVRRKAMHEDVYDFNGE